MNKQDASNGVFISTVVLVVISIFLFAVGLPLMTNRLNPLGDLVFAIIFIAVSVIPLPLTLVWVITRVVALSKVVAIETEMEYNKAKTEAKKQTKEAIPTS
jgi:type VI protein secretion system component VasK